MKNRNHGLCEKEMELVKLLMADCESTGDIHAKLKRLFAGTIEQMLEAEMDEHLGYEKNSVLGNNTGNSRNGYGKKTITSDYGECEIAVPRDRNGEFVPKVIEKGQTHTDEIEQKILAMYAKGMSQRDIEDILKEIYSSWAFNISAEQKEIRQYINEGKNLILALVCVTAELGDSQLAVLDSEQLTQILDKRKTSFTINIKKSERAFRIPFDNDRENGIKVKCNRFEELF